MIEYAIFWIVFAGVLVIISLFPWLVTLFTRLLGMQLPVNFVFMVFIFILLLKLFMMTIELSTLENKVKDLTQDAGSGGKGAGGRTERKGELATWKRYTRLPEISGKSM